LQRGWIDAQRAPKPGTGCHVDDLLARAPRSSGLITMLDGHAAALSWLGAVRNQRIVPLGVEKFGQSGSITELYKAYGLDVDAIVGAAARLCVDHLIS
jgi:pyruvate dehydrogenase E1 component